MNVHVVCSVLLLVPFCFGKSLVFEQNGGDGNVKESQAVERKHWALIVAGSNEWYNYRHQADACHAYHIVRSHGIPDERIVVMMYDDIAYNVLNPTPGIIINRPGGSDVYHGVPKDYNKDDVTPENFLKILQGHDMTGIGSGKTIKSGPNDHVFVYFADHGGPGMIGFPNDLLHASDLNEAIKSMSQNKKYGKMVFYIEACESGSMFDGLLPSNINVFATTAANGQESSYACYPDHFRQTLLGDVYSVKWMEDSDVKNLKTETLREQFLLVKKETNTSHVQEFGDLSMGNIPLAEFQGGVNFRDDRLAPHGEAVLDAVPQEDVPLFITKRMVESAKTPEEREKALTKYRAVLELRMHVDRTFDEIVRLLTNNRLTLEDVVSQKTNINDHQCYKKAVSAISKSCFVLSKVDYALRHLYKFVNLCEHGVNPRMIDLAVAEVCHK